MATQTTLPKPFPGPAPRRLEDLYSAQARVALPPLYGPGRPLSHSLIDFTYGLADPAMFPHEELREAAEAVLRDQAAEALNYGPAYAGLIELVAERMAALGVETSPEGLLISYGSSQILALLPQVLVDPGDVVLVEGPTFMGAVRMFANAGARLVTLPTDAQGLDIDALEATLADEERAGARVKFLYTIPNFQNPTGTTMSLERRRRLVDLAAERGLLVVEDDAYGDLSFDGPPPARLAALDRDGWVLYVGTFSKILAPGLRLGWACGSPALIARLAQRKAEGATGPFLTRLLARFCAAGRLEEHIRALNQNYRRKHDLMLEMITRVCQDRLTIQRPGGGFFLWCGLPPGQRASALLPLAEQHGVTFLPGTQCFANGQGDDAFRLAFSFLPDDQIVAGIERLGAALGQLQ